MPTAWVFTALRHRVRRHPRRLRPIPLPREEVALLVGVVVTIGVDVVVSFPLAGDLRGVAPRLARPVEVGDGVVVERLDDGPALVALFGPVLPAVSPLVVGRLRVVEEEPPVLLGRCRPPGSSPRA